jgi:hypothetical protein
MKIIQIIPAAPGWYIQDPEEEDAKSNIALWALVEDKEGQRILPLLDDHCVDDYADVAFAYVTSGDIHCYLARDFNPLLKGDK